MILGTIRNGSRDGRLVIVNAQRQHYALADDIAPTLQAALDDWDNLRPKLESRSKELNDGKVDQTTPVHTSDFHAPLPRAYEWVDGSAYINHIVLVRKARGAEPPETLETDPLVYQGGSGVLLGPTDDIPLRDADWGCDFEAEICVILGDTPEGTPRDQATDHIRLITIANDVSFRNLIPGELAKGFGFFNSKPATAFAPFALTPDELGGSWKEGRLHLPLVSTLNGSKFGDPEAGPEMHFSFFDLVAHICKTRSFTAGTILGSGTISNRDRSRGSSCLAEKRMIEKIDSGSISTPFMQDGDRIQISMSDAEGKNLFGTIEQTVRTPR